MSAPSSLSQAIVTASRQMAGSSSSSCSLLLVAAGVLWLPLLYAANAAGSSCQLTAGFTRVTLNASHFLLQSPHDLPVQERYDPCGGVHRMWVFDTDKPISTKHPGGARTEIKLNEVYSSGVWQFEGDVYVPTGTSGAAVMQISGADKPHASTVMLPVYNGQLTYYHNLTVVVEDGVYDRWMRLNVVHDVAAGNVTVYVDGERRLQVTGHGGKEHYFKFGVNTQVPHEHSHRMEAHWKNVAIYKKP